MRFGFKALKCAGYHPRYNRETDPEKKYNRAKAPIRTGFTDTNYEGLTVEECEQWEGEGGWTGWLIPPRVIVLDIDGNGWEGRFTVVREIYNQKGLNPPVQRRNNGVLILFAMSGDILTIKSLSLIQELLTAIG